MSRCPTPSRYSVSGNSAIGLLSYAQARGIATAGIVEALGLQMGELARAQARLDHDINNELWSRLTHASGDSDFGLHFAERLTLEAFDVVGHLLVRSSTFGEGLERVAAFSQILHNAGRVELERTASDAIIYPCCRGAPLVCPRQIAEFSVASVVVLSRRVTGLSLVPHRVTFQHPAPAKLHEHVRIFGVTPSFSQPETSLSFAREVLDVPVLSQESGVLTYLDAYARDVLSRLPVDDGILHRIESILATMLSSCVPDMQGVAKKLGMSARTLQRRLAEHQTSFQELLDGVRRNYAECYLADDRLALAEIAFLVGFSDPSNFHRAFRRWTGTTPAAFRERALTTLDGANGDLQSVNQPSRSLS